MDELVTSHCCNRILDQSDLKGHFGSQFKRTAHHSRSLRHLDTLQPQMQTELVLSQLTLSFPSPYRMGGSSHLSYLICIIPHRDDRDLSLCPW